MFLGFSSSACERLDSIRHVGVAEDRFVQQIAEPVGMKRPGQLQQFLQIDNLVIAPVTDVAPRIVGFLDFPVDAFLGDPVRVVAIHRRRVDELGDDVFDEFRVAERQCLPVLENVAPVALIRQQLVAVFVFQPDGELIPGATRVAVATTERDRQVFVAQTRELRVAVFLQFRQQLADSQLLGQAHPAIPGCADRHRD